jgi:putative ABC transport system permease protein
VHAFQQAARVLRRTPVFTTVAVSILAAGMAANTAMFSIVSAVLIAPLPFRSPESLIAISQSSADVVGARISPPTYLHWREHAAEVSVIAWAEQEWIVAGAEPVRAKGASVSHNFFEIMGEPVTFGRVFAEAEDRAGAPRVAVIGHALWLTRFGGDPDLVGKTITLEGRAVTVIGVARPGFDYPEGTELWTPLVPDVADALEVGGARFLRVIGRIPHPSGIERARAELAAIAAAAPDNADWSVVVRPLHDDIAGDVRPALLLLMAAVALVLLIACANVGNLLLARGEARRHEFAVRAALGASRTRIASEILAESLLLAGAAGAIGTLAALWGLRLFVPLLPTDLPALTEPGLDGRVLAFAIGVSAFTGLLAGSVPVLRTSHRRLGAALRQGGRGGDAGSLRGRMRAALVIAEVALSVVLLAGAGLLIRTFLALTAVDPGFRPASVTTFDFGLPSYRYAEPRQWSAFTDELLERTHALPGVTSVALTRNLPISGRIIAAPVVIGDAARDASKPPVNVGSISPDYFATLGIRVVRGRAFDESDRAGSPRVAVVDEVFARTFFGDTDPIGGQVRTLFEREARTIVGVVAEVRQRALDGGPEPVLYVPMAQDPRSFFTLAVRSALPAGVLTAAVRGVVRDIDPDQPLGAIATMDDLIARSIARPRFYSIALGAFAATAVALAMVGLYAVLMQMVVLRTHEIGLRMALGARGRDVMRLVARDGMRLALIGAAIGLAAAFACTRLLRSLLFTVTPSDPVTFAAVVLLLLASAALAAVLPARRAAATHPMAALQR